MCEVFLADDDDQAPWPLILVDVTEISAAAAIIENATGPGLSAGTCASPGKPTTPPGAGSPRCR